jgi:hypothetical protein
LGTHRQAGDFICPLSFFGNRLRSSQDKMAGTFSQNGGELTLQKGNLLPALRLSEKGKTQIKAV